MRHRHYILDAEHRPVAVEMLTWAEFFADFSNRRVAEDFTRFHRISTVFLGLDHNFHPDGPAILFETMVFEREAEIREIFGRLTPMHDDVEMWRYASWDDAQTGHAAILRRYRKAEQDALQTLEGQR